LSAACRVFGGCRDLQGRGRISDQPPHARINRGPRARAGRSASFFPRLTVAENLRPRGPFVPRAQAGLHCAEGRDLTSCFPRLHERPARKMGRATLFRRRAANARRSAAGLMFPHQKLLLLDEGRRSVSRRSLSRPSSRPSSSCARRGRHPFLVRPEQDTGAQLLRSRITPMSWKNGQYRASRGAGPRPPRPCQGAPKLILVL